MTAWHELVVEGAERTLRAFVAGFLAGRGEHAGGVFGSDIALAAGSFGERLKALFTAGSHQVFLAPEPLAVPLARAFGERGRELGLVVERHRVVESTKFSFRAEAFSRRGSVDSRRVAHHAARRCAGGAAVGKGGNASRSARTRAIRAAARVRLPCIGRYRRSFRRGFGSVAARANSGIRGNGFAPFGRENPLRVAAARVLPCSARWSRSSQTATGRGRDATTEEPRDRDSGARAQGARPADRESLGQHRRGRDPEAPPAPARAPRSGPPARLQDEAPSRPAAQDGLGA